MGRLLARQCEVVAVADLAARLGCAERRTGHSLQVDLSRLARRMGALDVARPRSKRPRASVLTGHLAHLLPVRDVIVLRCHPRELRRRLQRRGARVNELRANVASEAIGVILFEAAACRRGGRLWEVDTTGRSPSTVARVVGRLLRNRPASRFGHVDWLADPWVTEQLLRDTD
ncbi:MAG: AAA family ATPase [Thermoplasmata archaeon]|nr:AAA family ATPase [Thermoplasmata archaeon]